MHRRKLFSARPLLTFRGFNPDARPNRFSGLGYAGSGVGGNAGQQSGLDNQRPDSSYSNLETGVRWGATFDNWDVALMAAEVFDDSPVITGVASENTEVVFPRFQMFGGGINLSTTSLLWKGEIAYKKNRLFNTDDGFLSSKNDTLDLAIGFEYNGNLYSVNVDMTNQYIHHWADDILGFDRNESLLISTVSRQFLNDTVTLQYTASYQFQNKNQAHRIRYNKNINDNVSFTLQSIFVISNSDNSVMNFLNGSDILSANIELTF